VNTVSRPLAKQCIALPLAQAAKYAKQDTCHSRERERAEQEGSTDAPFGDEDLAMGSGMQGSGEGLLACRGWPVACGLD